jgi:hypothetical protein
VGSDRWVLSSNIETTAVGFSARSLRRSRTSQVFVIVRQGNEGTSELTDGTSDLWKCLRDRKLPYFHTLPGECQRWPWLRGQESKMR